MNWNIFKSNKDETLPEAQGTGTATQAAPTPFFNVMPKARVVSLDAPANTSVSKSVAVNSPKTVTPTPAVAPQVASSSTSPVVLSDSAKMEVLPSTRRLPKSARVAGALVAVGLALAVLGYLYITLSKNNGPLSGIKKLWQKEPAASITPSPSPSPTPTASVYRTPEDWRAQFFGTADCEVCADTSDIDSDGLQNFEEFEAETNPKSADSDTDGLADGDEVHIFSCSPTNKYSAGNEQYSDADDMRGGWDCASGPEGDIKLSEERKTEIIEKAVAGSFHEPTITTLGGSLEQYKKSGSSSVLPSAQVPVGTDTSPDAVLTRDVQRLNTIKKIAGALLKYKTETKQYPVVASFDEMATKVKPFNPVATNTADPLNVPPFVYGYELDPTTNSFSLSYYSETQKQLIRYTEAQAKTDSISEEKQARDSQRMEDLDKIRAALLIYSAAIAEPSQSFVFPKRTEYQEKIAPQYIQLVPKDPLTGKDYDYQVGLDGSTFSLKAILELPAQGTTGFACNQEDCKPY